MAYLRSDNPYNPHYAMPKNAFDEPRGRGAIVTRYLPRRTISPLEVSSGGTGYALTKSIVSEPYGGNPKTTRWARRRTIATLISPELVTGRAAGPAASLAGGIFDSQDDHGSLGGCNCLSSNGLGSLGDNKVPIGGPGDPIANFGKESAALVLRNVKGVDPALRKVVLKNVLDAMDPGLWGVVETTANKLRKEKNYDAKTALEKAIAIAFANRVTTQLIKVGQTGQVPMSGLVGLGTFEGRSAALGRVALGAFEESKAILTSGGTSSWSINDWYNAARKEGFPFKVAKAACEARGWKFAISPFLNGPICTNPSGSPLSAITGTVKTIAKTVTAAAKATVNQVAGLYCKYAKSGLMETGARIAGTVQGGQKGGDAAATGAEIVKGACAAPATPIMELPPPPPPKKVSAFPVVPVVLGAGVLLAAVLLMRKK